MSGAKAAKAKAARADPSPKRTKPPKSSAADPRSERGAGPVGQRLWDMPYSAAAPRLINPELGLHNLVTRAGHNAGYTIDVTLLDAPDHRLIRSGVLLAHRVLHERGEWYLGAPGWDPLLPRERVEPMGHSDLPEELVDLIRPFRRRATLGPVAALTCERREFALRDDRGTTMALLRDDKVTVRRGGLTTARYREVMLTPLADGLSDEQAAHVAQALATAGATPVPRFPRLVTRLGAPATGLSDFPTPQGVGPDATFTQFVSHVLATRLRQILCADLAIRNDRAGGPAELSRSAAQLRSELQGLSGELDEGWLQDLDEELEWVVAQTELEVAGGDTSTGRGDLKRRLQSERYLTLLDRLVTATRAPKVGHAAVFDATAVLAGLLDTAQATVAHTARGLSVSSPPSDWEEVTVAFEDLLAATEVSAHLLPGRAAELRRRLEVSRQLLSEARQHHGVTQRSLQQSATAAAAEAFELGRVYERELAGTRLAQAAFVRQWAKTAKKLE